MERSDPEGDPEAAMALLKVGQGHVKVIIYFKFR